MGEPEPVLLTDNVEVTDAFVDFNLRGSSPGELVVKTDGKVDLSTFEPIGDDRTTYYGDEVENFIVENEHGLFAGFRDGPVQPPADTSPNTYRHELEHVDGHTIERVKLFEHMTAGRQNKLDPLSVVSIRTRPADGHTTTYPVRVSVAYDIVERYVNGPLGTETVSFWAYYHGPSGPGSTIRSHADYSGYRDCEVVMFHDDIYTWALTRPEDIDDEMVVYEPGARLYVVTEDEYDSTRAITHHAQEAQSEVDMLASDCNTSWGSPTIHEVTCYDDI